MIDCMQSNEFEKGSMCSSKINMIINVMWSDMRETKIQKNSIEIIR